MFAVAKTQNPEHGHVAGVRIPVAADSGVKATASELRFALWRRVYIAHVVFERVDSLGDDTQRRFQMLSRDEIHVVARGVIFRKGRELAALEEPDIEIEAR